MIAFGAVKSEPMHNFTSLPQADVVDASCLGDYLAGRYSFIAGLRPDIAVNLTAEQVLAIVQLRFGSETVLQALNPSVAIASPVVHEQDGHWIKGVHMVGVNVRTIGSFWRVVHYALTLPDSQSGIHLLPIWEPGVVASLYGMASWNINPAFFDADLANACPWLQTVEDQLKVVVNILHLLGKTVGMDVIPHTDRYAEIVLANPAYFEWLQRSDDVILSHRPDLYLAVEQLIRRWLLRVGPAVTGLGFSAMEDDIFAATITENLRLQLLFGSVQDRTGRNDRRASLVDWLYAHGMEPVPATMGPPYRGLEVDPDPAAKSVDSAGRVWRDYRICQPTEMSRVFGPLSRYKFFETVDDTAWTIQFDRPLPDVWKYFCDHYADIQARYGFDFMRGDMSHVQMRPEGVPFDTDAYYDPHKAVKRHIIRQAPYFAYFAESFLAGPDYMAFGDEVDHLELSEAEVTLGDLQSMSVGGEVFMANFRRYVDILQTRQVAPAFTLITGDKDDPRFDKFYLHGNEARYFMATFLTDMPAYMSLGFELRDLHPVPFDNEYYTKLYVFQIAEGPKATKGPYRWGNNQLFFERINRLRLLAEDILPLIRTSTTRWLLPPDPTAAHSLVAWTQAAEPHFIFVVNLHAHNIQKNGKLPVPADWSLQELEVVFSTHTEMQPQALRSNGLHYQLPALAAGEGVVLRVK